SRGRGIFSWRLPAPACRARNRRWRCPPATGLSTTRRPSRRSGASSPCLPRERIGRVRRHGDVRPVIFPISDDDRHLMSPAWVSIILLGINVAVFLLQLADPSITSGWSVIPDEITHGIDLTEDLVIRQWPEIFRLP